MTANAKTGQGPSKNDAIEEAIGKMLSNEERGHEPDAEDAAGSLAARQPVPTAGATPAEAAARERLAEIERRVGELVHDPALEGKGAKGAKHGP